ncbi:ATP-binding protein [Peribacillus frigoritolerans]|nr:ATP-binding protein [Peribacillus frigoritolerans]
MITIEVKNESASHVRIVIKDNGIGIDPEQLQKLGHEMIVSKKRHRNSAL